MTGRRIIGGIAALAAFAGIWFAIAGRATWWQGWAFLLVFVGYVGILVWRLSRSDPELVQERIGSADRAEAWDRLLMQIYRVVVLILLALVALDAGRYRWTSVSPAAQLVGWLLLFAAGAMIWHVMMTNAYLSSYSRLQPDRDQTVVQDGAYRWIRHPMYLANIIAFLGIPLALGSWWGLLPALLVVGLFVYRTYREDLMLIHGLRGYRDYAHRVRYRLLPGIW
jgi:protein-S-isoprenylcysteine O-methyltransferase Ste14